MTWKSRSWWTSKQLCGNCSSLLYKFHWDSKIIFLRWSSKNMTFIHSLKSLSFIYLNIRNITVLCFLIYSCHGDEIRKSCTWGAGVSMGTIAAGSTVECAAACAEDAACGRVNFLDEVCTKYAASDNSACVQTDPLVRSFHFTTNPTGKCGRPYWHILGLLNWIYWH